MLKTKNMQGLFIKRPCKNMRKLHVTSHTSLEPIDKLHGSPGVTLASHASKITAQQPLQRLQLWFEQSRFPHKTATILDRCVHGELK